MPDPEVVTAAFGRNVRRGRVRLGWTLDDLAGRSGVSKGMLVQVEQARTNPSLATICRLATALGTSIADLVEAAEAPATQVVRADDGVALWRGDSGGLGKLMVGSGTPDQVELWDITYAPGDALESEPHAAGTRELILVINGELTLEVAGHDHRLGPGDAVAFVADRQHAYRNRGDTPLRLTMSVIHPAGAHTLPAPAAAYDGHPPPPG
jgi:transcriptional regulator with XRE-family HTH domain